VNPRGLINGEKNHADGLLIVNLRSIVMKPYMIQLAGQRAPEVNLGARQVPRVGEPSLSGPDDVPDT
jgi:hypothetical protein